MYMYMYIYKKQGTCICIYVYTYTQAYAHTYTYTYTYMPVHIHLHGPVHIHIHRNRHVHIHMHMWRPAYCQYYFEVYLSFLIQAPYQERGTIMLVIFQGPTVVAQAPVSLQCTIRGPKGRTNTRVLQSVGSFYPLLYIPYYTTLSKTIYHEDPPVYVVVLGS